MTLKNRIQAILTALGLTTAVVVGINETCVLDAVVLDVQDQRVCFESIEDYETYKADRVAAYSENGALYMYTNDGYQLQAIINYEREQGNLQIPADFLDEGDKWDKLINQL